MSIKQLHFKLGEKATEGSKLLKIAYEGHKMVRTQVFEWLSKFKSGVTSDEDVGHFEIEMLIR
jgi:hypothetical protein